MQIDLGAKSFGTGVRDGSGSLWRMGIPDGWDAATFRNSDGDPTGREGAFETEALDGARMLTCSGAVRCVSEAIAWDVYNYLPTLAPNGSDIDLVVHEPAGNKSLKVRQAARPDVRRPQGNVVFFDLALKALYPHKRSTSSVVVTIAAGATASFTHSGTFPAEMEVRTTSTGTVTLTSYGAIQGTGATSVPSGSIFTSGFGFTNLPRTAVGPTGLNLYNSLIPTNHWLAVLAGANSIQNTGSANVQVTYYPTWL